MNFIGGRWQPAASGASREVRDPADNSILALVPMSDATDARAAIAAAKQSFYDTGNWRRMPSAKRAEVLLRVADLIRQRTEELARLDSRDNGKPLREARADVEDSAACFRYYAGLIGAPQ